MVSINRLSEAEADADYDPTLGEEPRGPEALNDVQKHLNEVVEYASLYLAAKADAIKLQFRMMGMWAALGMLGGMAAAAFIIYASVLLLSGLAGGLAVLLDGRLWLAEIIVGAAVLLLIAGTIYFAMNTFVSAARLSTERKYEQRQAQQRLRFGTNARERAERA
jgi:hypothetical protein